MLEVIRALYEDSRIPLEGRAKFSKEAQGAKEGTQRPKGANVLIQAPPPVVPFCPFWFWGPFFKP